LGHPLLEFCSHPFASLQNQFCRFCSSPILESIFALLGKTTLHKNLDAKTKWLLIINTLPIIFKRYIQFAFGRLPYQKLIETIARVGKVLVIITLILFRVITLIQASNVFT
jgi:hypothetical protein